MRDIGYNICPTAAGGDNITHNPNRDIFIEKMKTICSGENNPMFGKSHSNESKQLQKDKAKGRFSLDWFNSKYGNEIGQKKYDERRWALKNRKINYSNPSTLKGKTFGPMSEENKQKIRDTRKMLKSRRGELMDDIKRDEETVLSLSHKYGMSIYSIKYYKRKFKNGML
jgi:hypothetical protein